MRGIHAGHHASDRDDREPEIEPVAQEADSVILEVVRDAGNQLNFAPDYKFRSKQLLS
jgi:hypothetical protein